MSEVQRLAALVADLQGQVTSLTRERRLSSASMEGGAITVYQPGTKGELGVVLGQQSDGTYAPVPLGGPTPPVPEMPAIETVTSGVQVEVSGRFAQAAATAPLDFARFEVQVSDSPEFPTGPNTRSGHVTSPAGGGRFVPWKPAGTMLYARARTWSMAKKFSGWSPTAGPVEAGKIGVADLGFDISSLAGNRIHYGDVDPTADPEATVSYGDLWLKEIDPGPPPVYQTWRWTPAQGADPDRWVLLADQDASNALAAAVAAQQAADAKAAIFHEPTPPEWSGPAGSAMWFDTDDGRRPYRWDGTQWADARLGNGAITPQSLVASDVIATGTVSAGLLEAIMVLATVIIAGDPDGTHARMTPTGFRVFRPDANGDGIPDEVVRLGTDTDDNFAIVRANGSLAAAIDSSGAGTLSALTVSRWPVVAAPDYTGRGGNLLDVLDRRPRGLVGWGSDTGTWESNTTAGRGIFDVAARLYYGRMYKITVKCRVNGTVQNDALAEIQVRWTESEQGSNLYTPPPPAAPTINSPIAGRYQTSIARAEAQGVVFSKPFSYGPGQPDVYRDVRFLLCLARPVGSTTISMYGAGDDITELIIEDVGPYLTPTKTLNDGGGTVQNPGPPPAPQTQRYTRSWVGTWHQNWLPSGAFIDLPGASQGRDPSNGNMRSYLGFSGAATDGSGLGMDHIIGAQIESVWLYLYSWHWYYNDGGPAIIGMHGFRNPAPGFGGGNEWMVGGVWFNKPGFNWVDLGPAGFGNWADGTWKGIMLGSTLAGADSLRNYGRFTDETDPNNKPVITVTYRR